MLAIHTKILPPTNTKGKRIKAYTSNGHALIVSPDDSLGDVEQHFAAAKRLIAAELKYVPDYSRMAYGGSADGSGYSFCFLQSIIGG
jgi:hypothetical protein